MPSLSLVVVDLLRMQTLMRKRSYRLAPSKSQRSLIQGLCSTMLAQMSLGSDNKSQPSLRLGTCTISVKQIEEQD